MIKKFPNLDVFFLMRRCIMKIILGKNMESCKFLLCYIRNRVASSVFFILDFFPFIVLLRYLFHQIFWKFCFSFIDTLKWHLKLCFQLAKAVILYFQFFKLCIFFLNLFWFFTLFCLNHGKKCTLSPLNVFFTDMKINGEWNIGLLSRDNSCN